MMHLLTTFAAFSLAGTVVLSLLPEGSLKRTASMAVGLLTLLCWAEGIASLFGFECPASIPSTVLMPTTVSVETAATAAAIALSSALEVTP